MLRVVESLGIWYTCITLDRHLVEVPCYYNAAVKHVKIKHTYDVCIFDGCCGGASAGVVGLLLWLVCRLYGITMLSMTVWWVIPREVERYLISWNSRTLTEQICGRI